MFRIMDENGVIEDKEAFQSLKIQYSDCLEIYRIMRFTRALETRLSDEFPKGRLRLYISPRGQEATEVASAYMLNREDAVFWYSRSQGAPLAKKVTKESILRLFYGVKFDVNDMLSRRVAPPYVLVASHMMHAVGWAWAQKKLGRKAIGVSYSGDGSTSEGDFHSALSWASIYDVPTIFVIENNQYSITPHNLIRQTPVAGFAQRAAGYGIEFETVDGNDFLAVMAAMNRALRSAREKSRPYLFEAATFRLAHHTTAMHKELPGEKEIVESAKAKDPLHRCYLFLINEAPKIFGLAPSDQWTEEEDRNDLYRMKEEIQTASEIIYTEERPKVLAQGAEIIAESVALHNSPRQHEKYRKHGGEAIAPDYIDGIDAVGAIGLAIHDIMKFDLRMLALGEDIGHYGSVLSEFSIHKKIIAGYEKEYGTPAYQERLVGENLPLIEIFGPERIIDSPLDEKGIIGHAIGLSLGGMNVLAAEQFSGFAFNGMDQLKMMSRLINNNAGNVQMPTVFMPFGGGEYIEYHRESEIPYFINDPGLIIVSPSCIQDFYDMLWASMASKNAVMYFADKNLYHSLRGSLRRNIPKTEIEKFGIRVAKVGNDVTVTAYSRYVNICLELAEKLEREHGISLEVLDIRVWKPFDETTLINSYTKTGRMVVVQEEPPFGTEGIIARTILSSWKSIEKIRGPVEFVTAPPCHFPPSVLYKFYLPQALTIEEAIRKVAEY